MIEETKNQLNQIFAENEIQNFVGFYNALKRVHNRLIKEGYSIQNGEILPPSQLDVPRKV